MSCLEIYTDGSYNDIRYHGGWACVGIYEDDIVFTINNYKYQMHNNSVRLELLAYLYAVDFSIYLFYHLSHYFLKDKEFNIAIYTDCEDIIRLNHVIRDCFLIKDRGNKRLSHYIDNIDSRCKIINYSYRDLYELYDKMYNILICLNINNRIHTAKIKGHSGITGNELADQLSKNNDIVSGKNNFKYSFKDEKATFVSDVFDYIPRIPINVDLQI